MPEHREWRVLWRGLIVVDLALYACALVVGAHLSEHLWPAAHRSEEHVRFTLLLLPAVPVIFASQGLYQPQNLLAGTREYAAVFRACSYTLVAAIIGSFALRAQGSREWLVVSWMLATTLIGVARFAVRRIVYRLRRRGLFIRRVLLVGADAQAMVMARRLARPASGWEVVGVLDDYLPVGAELAGGFRVLGTSARLVQVAERTEAGEVIVVPQALPWESLQRLMAAGTAPDGLRMHVLGGFYDLLTTGVQLSQPNGVPMLTIRKVVLTPGEAVVKRAVDLVVATGLLVLLSPLLALAVGCLAIRGKPLIERTRVCGRRAQEFDVFTLSSGAMTQSMLVRKLPSLVNVLLGQLSLVGPHPTVAGATAHRSAGHLTTLRPGLTGLWRRSEDPAEQLLLDLYYVRGYSLWFDLQILFDRVRVRFRVGHRREATHDLEGEAVRLVMTTGRGGGVDPPVPVSVVGDRGVM
jgi:lipopolysaccharide/colanic/teichoic acid biosynthesis glycosyltransferase